MKTLFISAHALQEVKLTKEQIDTLPKPVGLVTTAQYEHKLDDLHNKIKDSVVIGTVLGCDVSKALMARVRSFLFVGTGQFHPIMIAMKAKKPVYVFNPFDSRISQVNEIQLIELRQKQKLSYIKFLNAKTIGILVTTKPGQQKLKKAFELKKSLKKNSYIFIDDTFDLNSLENFPFVDCFVNTACPRLPEDSNMPLINLEDLARP